MIAVPIKVRFYETDMMEVAHHTNHIRWFEMGRVEYFRSFGLSLWDYMNEGIVFPIKSVACTYVEPARFDDELVLETTLKKMTRAQMVFAYRLVRKEDGALIAAGETQNAFVAKDTGKVIRLPDKFYKVLADSVEKEDKHGKE